MILSIQALFFEYIHADSEMDTSCNNVPNYERRDIPKRKLL